MIARQKFTYNAVIFLFTILIFNCSSDDDSSSVIQPQANIFEGNVVLTSQAEVDAFGLERYVEIEGSMIIGFTNLDETNITNLNALNSIRSIQYGLTIQNNPLLLNLDGLNVLNFINGGALEIINNSSLESINALSNLLSFKSLFVEKNMVLLNLDGLESVYSARNGIIISDNQSLLNIDGLNGIITVGGEFLFIKDNYDLGNINGLSNLESVEGSLVVSNVNSANLSLGNLDYIGENLFISSNGMLTNIDTLESLNEVGGNISINLNGILDSFCGLVPLIESGSFSGSFLTEGNAYNPTIDNLNIDECSI